MFIFEFRQDRQRTNVRYRVVVEPVTDLEDPRDNVGWRLRRLRLGSPRPVDETIIAMRLILAEPLVHPLARSTDPRPHIRFPHPVVDNKPDRFTPTIHLRLKPQSGHHKNLP